MANKRQRKKAQQKATLGGQYRGGRASGRKNLKKTGDGQLLNQHGVKFTEAEKRRLESLVNSANYRRRKMIKDASKLPRKYEGVDTGDTIGSLKLMGKESDFILAKRTKSLQRFRTMDQFDEYVKRLEKVNSPNYLRERIRQYKRNYITSLNNVYGEKAKDVAMKIRMMKPDEYMKLVESDESLEISYNYPEDQSKLNRIRAALGMNLKDDEWLDEDDYM